MFGLVEAKVEKILESEATQISKLKKEKNQIKTELIKLEENIEMFDNIKNNKRNIGVGILIACGITITSFLLPTIPNIIYIVSSLICGASIINEIDSLKSNKRYLSYDNIDANKENHTILVDRYNELNTKVNSLDDLLTSKKETIEEYSEIRSNIATLKDYQSNLNKNSCELVRAVNYFSTKPELVFDTEDEYINYQSYDDRFIKTELVQSKLLEKRRNK